MPFDGYQSSLLPLFLLLILILKINNLQYFIIIDLNETRN